MRLLLHQKKLFSETAFKSFTPLETLESIDLNLSISRFSHKKTGAMIYEIKSNDKDRTFSPIVRTLPQNDTGCPHILEHLACCGSTRYPIRDPFFNMLRRSVNTYMNAWTGDDFTAYPFSSANQKDFQNLYKVYLDMCLKPLLNQLDFRQQGWRYQINSESGQKQIKGIVFNEMKGAYQNPDRQLYVQIANKLFNSTPFGYDSGGKPDSIAQLSYQQVKNMHSYYYHPSNMSFYYYGDSDITQNLKYLQSEYFQKYNYTDQSSQYRIKSQKLLSSMPKQLQQKFFTIKSHTAQTPNIAITYNLGLLQHASNVDITCLNILSYLLLSSNQATFYQEFIQAHLADSFGASGFNIGSVLTFGVVLKNVKIGSQEFYKKVEKCLFDIIQKGVDEKRVEEYVRQSEIDILTPKKNQGIKYLGMCMPYMINRLPLNNLAYIRSHLKAAVNKLKNKDQLKQLINKYFLKNDRKVVIRQQPASQKNVDPYANIKGLDMPQQIIRKQQDQLKIRQESASANSIQCLPKLSISDLTASVQKQFKVYKEGLTQEGNQLRQVFVEIGIPQINFVKAVFKLDMSEEKNKKLLPYLDLWKYTINQGIAVEGLTNKQLSSKLNLCCHEFRIQFEKSNQKNPSQVNIVFTASCLQKYLPQYIQLLNRIVFTPDFKQDDTNNVFRSYRMQKMQELLDGNVMQYCLDYGSCLLSQQAKYFNNYQWVTKGIQVVEQAKGVPQEFFEIHDRLRKAADITIIQHTSKYSEGLAEKLGFKYGRSSKKANQKTQQNNSSQDLSPTAVTNSYNVNFCSQQYLGPSFYSKQHAQICLFIEILQQDYLHQKIREKGGAYGARAIYRDVGTIALYSYMDPYSQQTYEAFQQSIKQLVNSTVNKQRLQEAKIKVIGNLQLPVIPQKQCLNRIYKNLTNEERSKHISWLREADWKSVVQTAKKYLLNSKSSKVMFGKDVPKGFKQQKLKIPKQQSMQQEQKSA